MIPKLAISKRAYRLMKTALLSLFFVHLNIPVFAVDFNPNIKREMSKSDALRAFQSALHQAHENGMCSPVETPIRTTNMLKRLGKGSDANAGLSTAVQAVDTVKVLVILVDFVDNQWNNAVGPYPNIASATIPMFDSLLFSTGNLKGTGITNPTGSMTEYYMEVSYGTFFIQGTIVGWYGMPKTYAEYVGSNHGLQPMAPNAQDLALDAINAADPDVDYSEFDIWGPAGVPDEQLDGVFIVHAGTGNEDSHLGGLNDIHSHKWNLRAVVARDGVQIFNYTMQPEESYYNNTMIPIGVFCHEYGHFLGLPDLYDTNGPDSSDGLGRWSIMASGNWLGDSRTPAHFDAWCKARMGFMTPTILTQNLRNVSFPQASDSAVCYLIRGLNMPLSPRNGEYFLVENRQKHKFDQFLPGSGLLIYHVDEAANMISNNNDNQSRYLVALEQADGRNDLAVTLGNDGDATDPFAAGTGYTEFTDLTVPSSRANGSSATTQVAVWNISGSGPVMTANLDKTYSRPYLVLIDAPISEAAGDGDEFIESGEEFEVAFAVTNRWANGANTYVKLRTTSSQITMNTDSIYLGTMLGFEATTVSPFPFSFTANNDITPSIDSLYLDFHSDNGVNLITIGLEFEIGKPQILIVNADMNGKHSEYYQSDLYTARRPSREHVIMSQGIPSPAVLAEYETFIWFFGDTTSTPPSAAQINAMKSVMDAGKNLMVSGQNLAEHLDLVDSAFMHNYLHAVDFGPKYWAAQSGIPGSPVTDGIISVRIFGNNGAANWTASTAHGIIPVNVAGVNPELIASFNPNGSHHALSYSGSYKLVFFSLPFEAIENNPLVTTRAQRDEVFNRVMQFFEGLSTDVGDDDDPEIALPGEFELSQNYPNPFNPSTTINYSIHRNQGASRERTELIIYNVLGQQVKQLVSREEGPGSYTVTWNGDSDSGSKVASGVYFYRLKRGDAVETKKMTLLK